MFHCPSMNLYRWLVLSVKSVSSARSLTTFLLKILKCLYNDINKLSKTHHFYDMTNRKVLRFNDKEKTHFMSTVVNPIPRTAWIHSWCLSRVVSFRKTPVDSIKVILLVYTISYTSRPTKRKFINRPFFTTNEILVHHGRHKRKINGT